MKTKKGIRVFTVSNPQEGFNLAKDLLYKNVDTQTLLLLSGGSQKILYEILSKEGRLKPRAVGLVDERFGEKMHDNSNEKMIRETGLIADLEKRGVKFYPVLENEDISITSENYEKVLLALLKKTQKKIAILGVGPDGHTAGLPPRRVQSSKIKAQSYVEQIGDFPGEFKERITLTFKALSEMDLLIVLAFGSAKQEAFRKMFEDGPIEEIPARFYIRPDIAPKTLLITDQKV